VPYPYSFLSAQLTACRYFRSGLAPIPSLILGREAEGTVVSTGPSGDFYNIKPGGRVVWLHTGGYAEYTSVPAFKAHLVPSEFPPGLAAASLLQGLTALTFIREATVINKNDWVLVHAAAGGTGLLLCQLLKEAGARTIGTSSTEEKMKLAKENGATHVLNYKTERDLVGKIKEITGGQGVSVVFDSTGKDQFENSVEVLEKRGTLVAFGISVSSFQKQHEKAEELIVHSLVISHPLRLRNLQRKAFK
jgi:NADPH2:quinone reductase